MTLVANNHPQPALAAGGINIVNMEVPKIPTPRVYFPPNLSASKPPGI